MKNFKNIIVLLCMLTTTAALPEDTAFFRTITMRCYYIKRLAQSVHFLSLLDRQEYDYKPCNIIKQRVSIQIDSISFFHHKINKCIHSMLLSASLKPLLLLLKEIRQYQHLDDEQLMHELLLLVFTVHKQIIWHECEDNGHSLKTITLNDIIIISEKINQLPIAEVLNAIDMLVTELPPFLEKYEFNSKISWKAWLKKYWWVPPAFGIWFSLKILLRLQRPQYYFSAYNTPKPPMPTFVNSDPVLEEITIREHAAKNKLPMSV
jgi:hypothetical protein